jgi:exodeoxyribonuclease VII small subunit
MSDNLEEMTFEDAFAALADILEKLEAGDLPLQEAIALFEQGMALAQQCNERLDKAELRISKLMPGGDIEAYDEGQ